jgi:hypothetical protein
VRFEFESGLVSFWFSFTFVSFGESHLLVSWCAGGRCGMACIDKDRGRSRRPGVEDRGWSHWSGGAVCGLHRARGDEERGFLGQDLKPKSTVCLWFGLKTTGMVSHQFGPQNRWRRFVSGLASKSLRRFLPVWPQNRWLRFLAVWPQNMLQWFSLVWPQNQWRRFSPVWPQNRWRRFLAVWPQNLLRRFSLVWPQN